MTTLTKTIAKTRDETKDHAARLGHALSGGALVLPPPDTCSACPHRRIIVGTKMLTLDINGQRARWGGIDLDLTRGEWRVVNMLVSESSHFVSYRRLYDVIQAPGFRAGTEEWGYKGNVRSMVKRVRWKFQKLDADFDAIKNYTGFGYAWKEEQ
jgi:DNA-binding response OmpR family regulator